MNAINQSVALRETQPLAYADMEKLAADIAASGLFGIKTKAQAMALMMISQAEGRHPALAARDYDIIQGRPAKKAEAMLRDFLEGGGKVQWHTLDDDEADATFSHPAGGTARINWNMARAAKAGLAAKENYKKFTRQMLRSRTVSEGVRTVYPLATSGMHVPEEVADFSGPTLEAHAEPEAPKPRRKAEAVNNSASMQVGGTGLPDPGGNGDAPAPARKQTISEWLDGLQLRLATCATQADVDAIAHESEVQKATAALRGSALEQLNRMIAAALERTFAAEPWDRETGEITPADRLTSGD